MFLNRYYIGHTEDAMEERLRWHLSCHSGYTAKAKDWEVVHLENFGSKEEAFARERQVKLWKSRAKIKVLFD